MSEDAAPETPDRGHAPSEAAAQLRLKVTAGEAAGNELSVADELVIGREAPGEGRLQDDIEISRMHARIARTPEGGWAIEDLGSRNGTFVNGHRIERRELLAAGDSIEVGATRLVVQVSAPQTPPAATARPPELGPTVVGAATPATPSPSPQPPTEPAPEAPTIPPVSLTLELDLAAGEALISLGQGSDRVRLAFEDGAWRVRPEV